jgi:carbamoylphosphate synthase small subunit
VDTRALTRHLRSAGAMRAAIAGAGRPQDELLDRIRAHPRMEGLDLTCGVSTDRALRRGADGESRFRVLAYDFGVKRNSLKLLAERWLRHHHAAGVDSGGGDPRAGHRRLLRIERAGRPGGRGPRAGNHPRAG